MSNDTFNHCAAEKLEQAENHMAHTRFGSIITPSQRKKEVSSVYYLWEIEWISILIACFLSILLV